MNVNNSSAVRQQRHEPHDSLDDFPTPPWATRAFLTAKFADADLSNLSVWEPACNRGFMARPLAERFGHVRTSDVFDYGWGGQQSTEDFLFFAPNERPSVDWIITNPPFKLAEQFASVGLRRSAQGVALLVRTAWLEGEGRYNKLFSQPDTRPTEVYQYVERVPINRGVTSADASTATAYCWVVFSHKGFGDRTRLDWIPPQRRKQERPGDYALPEGCAWAKASSS